MSLPLKSDAMDEPLFSDEQDHSEQPQEVSDVWRVLVVDDEPDIIAVTRLVFSSFTYQDKGIEIIPAYSAEEAKHILSSESDIAVAYIDVVMETDNAGLELVKFIRDELHNHDLQIILRTGQPGYAPEMKIIVEYGINDYRLKTDLDKTKLISSLVTALRGFQSISVAKDAERNRAMVEANGKARSYFFAQIGQAFRTPLNSVLGFCQLLTLSELAGDEAQFVDLIEWEVKGLLSSIGDAQEFAKLEAGHCQVESTEFSLESLLHDVLHKNQPQIKSGVSLALEIDESMPSILVGDVFRLQYVVNNLVANSIRFTEQGSVSISAKLVKRQKSGFVIELIVSDTGSGIPESVISWLSNPYDNSSSVAFFSVRPEGIGLLTCKQLVELLGGEMKIASAEQKGTDITLLLPFSSLLQGVDN